MRTYEKTMEDRASYARLALGRIGMSLCIADINVDEVRCAALDVAIDSIAGLAIYMGALRKEDARARGFLLSDSKGSVKEARAKLDALVSMLKQGA